MQQRIILQKQRDFSEKISATFDFLRQNFKPLFGALILIGGPIILIISIAVAYLALDISGLGLAPGGDVLNQMISLYSTVAISGLASWFIYIIVTTITFSYIKIYLTQPASTIITTDMVWQKSKKYILPIFFSSFIVALVVGFGTIFFIIPGIALAIYLTVINPLIIIEDLSFGEAFSKSIKMITDNFWSTFGFLFVTGLISWLIGFAFSIPNALLSGIHSFNSIQSGEVNSIDSTSVFGISFLITGVIANIGSYLLSVIPNVAVGIQYFNLKEEKESTGLIDQIAQMGGNSIDEEETY